MQLLDIPLERYDLLHTTYGPIEHKILPLVLAINF
jgi:hypothetical protein